MTNHSSCPSIFQEHLYEKPVSLLQQPLLFLRGTADPYNDEPSWQKLQERITSPDVQVGG